MKSARINKLIAVTMVAAFPRSSLGTGEAQVADTKPVA